ncbi:MAG: hypothetical protein ACKV2O_23975 [Acidimicrobiales bacterium]
MQNPENAETVETIEPADTISYGSFPASDAPPVGEPGADPVAHSNATGPAAIDPEHVTRVAAQDPTEPAT